MYRKKMLIKIFTKKRHEIFLFKKKLKMAEESTSYEVVPPPNPNI